MLIWPAFTFRGGRFNPAGSSNPPAVSAEGDSLRTWFPGLKAWAILFALRAISMLPQGQPNNDAGTASRRRSNIQPSSSLLGSCAHVR
jgi:hypothetical protein